MSPEHGALIAEAPHIGLVGAPAHRFCREIRTTCLYHWLIKHPTLERVHGAQLEQLAQIGLSPALLTRMHLFTGGCRFVCMCVCVFPEQLLK